MTTALLVLIAVLTAAAVVLMIASFRRRDGVRGLAGMTLMMVAAVPAAWYASLIDM
jgi:UDP-N-acetylmuramyl pentapeptide phosphotransferase/UDP-N-acetylglucosamine-1-phosphate transferase